jgi:hypothetical protein
MTGRRARVAAGSGVLVVLAAAIVLAIFLHSRGDVGGKTAGTTAGSTATSPLGRPEIAPADAARYRALFSSMQVGKTRSGTLRKWPEPYQAYRDQYSRRCYEWKSGRRLYNLCFTKGLLTLKDPQ